MTNKQKLLNFIKENKSVSYNCLVDFVLSYCDNYRVDTATCCLRHSRDKVDLIPKDPFKKNSPIIVYEWKEIATFF